MRRACCGFSLIELVVVLAILGLMAAVSLPAFASADSWSEHDLAEELAALLRSAQRTALVRGTRVEVHLDPDSGRWWAWTHDDPGALSTGGLELEGNARIEVRRSRALFRFSPEGAEVADSLTVTAGTGSSVSISVDRWTGVVRVLR